jgi:hypothetical protein
MKPMNETARLVLELLENTSFADSIKSYSGRGMEGKLCLGVEIPKNSLFELGYEMARAVHQGDVWADVSIIPAPHIDSMGHDMIAYWPSAKITCPIEDMEEVDE